MKHLGLQSEIILWLAMLRLLGKTASAEFLTRGFLWARVLILGAFMPLEEYGYIMILLAFEGLLSSISSYPSIKDILVRQDIAFAEFIRLSIFFGIIAIPFILFFIFFYDAHPLQIFAVILASYISSFSQVGLYMLRVTDLTVHNRTKLTWSILTTFVFLSLLPIHWAFLPVIYMVGAVPVLFAVANAIRTNTVTPAFEASQSYFLRGSAIYGMQALIVSFPQHGVRLFIAATMTLADVAIYTQTYMLATALFFVYSALMIVFEPRLSRSTHNQIVDSHYRLAFKLAMTFFVLAGVHFSVVYMTYESRIFYIFIPLQSALYFDLFSTLMIFIALNGIQTILNCLVLALSGRAVSLLSSLLGFITLFIGLYLLVANPDLISIGIVIAVSQATILLPLILFLVYVSINSSRGFK